jgi:AmiR/NasT family two-component response regulator
MDAASRSTQARAERPHGPRVLLCEADERASQAVRSALEAAGYAVCTARPGDASDASVEADPPDFAWVDVGSSSFEPTGLAPRLAAARIPFVLTSAANDTSLVQRAIDSGATACFFKPLDVSAIVPAIAVWMARAAELRRLADVEQSLRDALQSSRGVSAAVGILMERHGLDADGAFESLRRQARHERLSVQSLAARIVGERAPTPAP